MRGLRSALVACLLFGPLGCATSPDSVNPPPRAERPTYALGEKWIRNDGVYELVRIEDDRYIFSAGRDREIHLTRDLFPATVVKGVQGTDLQSTPSAAVAARGWEGRDGSGVVQACLREDFGSA